MAVYSVRFIGYGRLIVTMFEAENTSDDILGDSDRLMLVCGSRAADSATGLVAVIANDFGASVPKTFVGKAG